MISLARVLPLLTNVLLRRGFVNVTSKPTITSSKDKKVDDEQQVKNIFNKLRKESDPRQQV
jgi:hypothetical protein